MISHDNIVYLCQNMCNEQAKLKRFEERFVSYLPLSHIAAQAVVSCNFDTFFSTLFNSIKEIILSDG
jgi:long-subunit acyl-CoA synthetase (AMP-forming)